MFNYKDPGATLKPAKALNNYRQSLHMQYSEQAKRPLSAFTFLEAFLEMPPGKVPAEAVVEWSAFPITATGSNDEIDKQRFSFQDEYVEWAVQRQGSKVKQITFTTEFLEYYEALAAVGMAELVAGIKALIPAAAPVAKELFGSNFNPDNATPVSRAMQFRNFAQQNPWNNGKKGILCMAQQFNTLGALFNLAGSAGVVNNNVQAGAICATLGGFCGPNRNSDPSVATAIQNLARANRILSLKDPVGIEMFTLSGIWARNGTAIDINDMAANGAVWSISRNGRRATLNNVAGLTVDDETITTGAQVASRLRVRVKVIHAAKDDMPAWSRNGQENSVRLNQVSTGG